MRRFLILAVAVLAGWSLVAGQGASAACADPGAVNRYTYYSAWLGQNMVYSVYTPPCFDAAATYPTLYLMHGSNDDDGQWLRLGLQQALDEGVMNGTLNPMIVVLPFGNVIANRNRFDNVSWANIFLTELLPDVWNRLPAISRDPQQVAIGGISRGGFWAYQIGLRHPELFGTLGGHSAFFDLYHAQPQDNPLDLAVSQPDVAEQILWLDHGRDDYAAPGLAIMHERLLERGLSHTYSVYPQGEHNNSYWGSRLAEYLAFYSRSTSQPVVTEALPAAGPLAQAFVTNTPLPDFPTSAPTPEPFVPVTATPVPQATGYQLFVPVVAFPSTRTSLSQAELDGILKGQTTLRVLLPVTAQAQLFVHGVLPAGEVVADDRIVEALWANYDAVALMPFDQLNTRLRPLWIDDQPVTALPGSYPLAFPSANPNFVPERFARVVASGVTALTRRTTAAIDSIGVEAAVSGIMDYVTAADFFHTSNEVSIVEGCPRPTTGEMLGGGGSFCSKREHFDVLTRLEVDLVELTGNHNNDWGYQAYRDTLDWYAGHNIPVVGGGEIESDARAPYVFTLNNTTIGWLACNAVGPYYALASSTGAGGARPGAASCEGGWLLPAITALKQQVDVVIVTVQQLEIEDYLPTGAQRSFYRALVDAGADFVAGTQAHKPQIFEFYGDGLIHYGFGNLFFDQPFWGNSRFFMDTLWLYDGRLMTVELFPGIIEQQARPRLMTPEERLNFMFFMLRQQNGF